MGFILRFRLLDKHMPRETFKQTKRQASIQSIRQIDTQTNRETDK